MRTGTVASVDDRNWEISDPAIIQRLSQSRAIALDMELHNGCNGFRFRIHTAPCSASRTSPFMVKSTSPVWPTNSIASASASTLRSG